MSDINAKPAINTDDGHVPTSDSPSWKGWLVASLIALTVLAAWLPDLDLPLGDSDDGRILARLGMSARNYWEMGPADSGFGARIDPYIRAEYGIPPGTEPPIEAVTYAHHPPLQTFITIASVGLLGDSEASLRVVGFLVGAATVLFMAALARALGMAWGPTLLAIGTMAATGFFYVYGRIGVGYSLIAASAAMVAYLRQAAHPPMWLVSVAGVLACLTAMQSWIAMAAIGLLAVWLLITTGWSSATRGVAIGAAMGMMIVAAWLLTGTNAGELANRVSFRTDTTDYPFGDFLARQWRFASEFTPLWLRVVAPVALLAGLVDRRTRVPVAITLAVVAAWTFGLRQGAWIHRLWNFPWLAPITIGMVALLDAVRRRMARRLALAAGLIGALAVAGTFYGLLAGPVPDTYLRTPAKAGAILKRTEAPEGTMWVTRGVPTPRWVSYYLDVPVWTIEERTVNEVGSGDLVLVRTDWLPGYIQLPEESVLQDGRYRLLDGAKMGVR